mgnify:FL=1
MSSKKWISFVMVITIILFMFPSVLSAEMRDLAEEAASIEIEMSEVYKEIVEDNKNAEETDKNAAKEFVVNYSVKNGIISTSIASGQKVPAGTVLTFYVWPDEGYVFDYWLVKDEEGKVLSKVKTGTLKYEIKADIIIEAVLFEGSAVNPTVSYARKAIENLNYTWPYGKTMGEVYKEITAKVNNLKEILNLDSKRINISVVEIYGAGRIEIQISSQVEKKKEVVIIDSPEVIRLKEILSEIDALNLTWDTDKTTTIMNLKNNEELQAIIEKYKEQGINIEIHHDPLKVFLVAKNDSNFVKTGYYMARSIKSPEYEVFNDAMQEFYNKNFFWSEDLTIEEMREKIREESKDIVINANKRLRKINTSYRISNVFDETYYKDDNRTGIVTTLRPGLELRISPNERYSSFFYLINPKAEELINAYENADN